jgi:hypothetical protein
VTTPRIAFYENDRQIGIAKMAITAYAKNGARVTSTASDYGRSHETRRTILLFSWSESDLMPKATTE